MPPKRHSPKYASSKSSVWIKCPQSTLLNQGDDSITSDAAIFGTECHELGQRMVELALNIINYDEEQIPLDELRKKLTHYDEDMENIATGYCQAVVSLYDYYKSISTNKPLIYLETYLTTDMEETAGGTLDMGLYSDVDGGTIVIEDLKTGRKPVYAYDYDNNHINSQLGLYAIYFYEAVIKGLYPVKNVRLIIHQPVINNINEYSLSLEELLKFKEEIVIPAILKTKVNNLEAHAGSHCAYCAGRHLCTTYHKANLEVGQQVSKSIDQFSMEEIESILPKLDTFIKYAEDLKEFAVTQAKQGHKWKGLKLVPSKITRKIGDEEKVKQILENEGISPLSPGKLLGITEIQKRLGKEKFKTLISPHIILQESSLILVPETDPREEAVIDNKEDK